MDIGKPRQRGGERQAKVMQKQLSSADHNAQQTPEPIGDRRGSQTDQHLAGPGKQRISASEDGGCSAESK